MNEEENFVGKHSDVEEFIRAAKGSVPATSTDTPNTSAAPHERTFRGPGRLGRPMHDDGGLPKSWVSLCMVVVGWWLYSWRGFWILHF